MIPIRMRHVGSLLAMAALPLAAGCAEMDERGSRDYLAIAIHDAPVHLTLAIGERDRRLMHDYYHSYYEAQRRHHDEDDDEGEHHHGRGRGRGHGRGHGHNPHGEYAELPPGIQKQLRRNGRLPKGLERHRLPRELEERLDPLPSGYVRVMIGTQIMLLDQKSDVIVDLTEPLN